MYSSEFCSLISTSTKCCSLRSCCSEILDTRYTAFESSKRKLGAETITDSSSCATWKKRCSSTEQSSLTSTTNSKMLLARSYCASQISMVDGGFQNSAGSVIGSSEQRRGGW